MNSSMITHFYRTLLCLFPRRFRSDFGEEMQSVFAEVLFQAKSEGSSSLVKAVLLELGSLPGAALRQHLIGIYNISRDSAPQVAEWEGPPSRIEILMVLAVFALPAVNIWMNFALDVSIGLLAAFSLAVFLAGLLRGFPRWSLPSLGLALSTGSFLFLYQWIADLVTPSIIATFGPFPRDESTLLVLQAFWAGLMWLCLFALTFLVLGCLALLRRFRSLLWRIRQDWTLASYILYSGAIFTLALTFDQYRFEKTYAVASMLCLTTGAWLYLRSPRQWQRTLSLLIGLSLAMVSATFSQWAILSMHDLFTWKTPDSARWLEVRWTILEWVWMVVFILAPIWLRLLPKPGRRTTPGL